MNAPAFPSGRIGAFEPFLTQPDPGVTPSLQRAIRTLPASQQIELALWIIMDGDIGDYDPHHHSLAECALGQLAADQREAELAEARHIADGRSTTGLWL